MFSEASILVRVIIQSPNCVGLFATPWTVACQVPLPMEFSSQGHWSGCYLLLQELG